MSDPGHDDGGRFTRHTSDEELLRAFERTDDPVLTASEIAADLPIGSRAVRERLKGLRDDGYVAGKEVGARTIVWWRLATAGSDAPWRDGFGAFADSDLDAEIEALEREVDAEFEADQDELF